MEHVDRVKRLVRREPDLLETLIQPYKPTFKQGPRKPPYAEAKQKSVVNMTGANIILLKKMVRDELKADSCTKVTKSLIVNYMMEYYLENHTDAKSRKMQDKKT